MIDGAVRFTLHERLELRVMGNSLGIQRNGDRAAQQDAAPERRRRRRIAGPAYGSVGLQAELSLG